MRHGIIFYHLYDIHIPFTCIHRMMKHSKHLILFTLLASSSSKTSAFSSTSQQWQWLTSYHTTSTFTSASTLTRDHGFELKAKSSRRAFLVENIVTPAAAAAVVTGGAAITFHPKIANAEEEGSGGDFFKEAQERMAARNAARAAARDEKKSKSKPKPFFSDDSSSEGARSNNNDSNEFVFKAKVQEIQEGIAERKERAILINQEEMKRTEENEFIQELKARSAANKDIYKKEAMRSDKLSNRQFGSQYNRPSYTGVQRSDGSIQMVTAEELETLDKAGRIQEVYEIKVNKDGEEYTDYSKKILKLKGDNPLSSSPSSASVSEVVQLTDN